MKHYGDTKWVCHACGKECSDADDIRECRWKRHPPDDTDRFIHKECDKDGSWLEAHEEKQ